MQVEANVYTVERKEGKIFVRDVNGKVVYGSSDEGFIIYTQGNGEAQVSKVKDLSDTQLLKAIATSVSIEPK